MSTQPTATRTQSSPATTVFDSQQLGGLWLCLLGAAAIFSGGCTSHTRTPMNSAAIVAVAPAAGQASDPAFQYPKTEISFENHTVGQGATPNYSEREITIPSVGVSPQGDAWSGSIFPKR